MVVSESSDCMGLTSRAFDEFRVEFGPSRSPPEKLIRNQGEVQLMRKEDGLNHLDDGQVPNDQGIRTEPRLIEQSEQERRHLWVVRTEDVVHAEESCSFGKSLPTGSIKHTNLTGGAPAYAGGELLHLDGTIVVNGRSGRYGPRSAEEMDAVALAFKRSGYLVWSMGYDIEADFPFPFVGVLPKWVE